MNLTKQELKIAGEAAINWEKSSGRACSYTTYQTSNSAGRVKTLAMTPEYCVYDKYNITNLDTIFLNKIQRALEAICPQYLSMIDSGRAAEVNRKFLAAAS